jgi:hypothetical protein
LSYELLMRLKFYGPDFFLPGIGTILATSINHTMYKGPYHLDIEILGDRYEEEQKLLKEIALEVEDTQWEDGNGY